MVGAMVIGPTYFSIFPTRPEYPAMISNTDPRITAPCTCNIRTSQPTFESAAMPQIAIAGVSNEKVPPCTSGSRFPQDVCSSVVIPLTKNIVPIRIPMSLASVMPSASAMISGIATVDPNIVR